MLGKRNPQQPLFYYFNMFNMADIIPKNHILRLINKYVDFSFIRSKVEHLYSVLILKYLSACSLLGIFMALLQKYEDYLKHAREQTKTPFYRISQRMRKLIEGLLQMANRYPRINRGFWDRDFLDFYFNCCK